MLSLGRPTTRVVSFKRIKAEPANDVTRRKEELQEETK